MQYLVNERLRDFKFWGGSAYNVATLTLAQLDELEDIIPDMYESETLTDTQINDLFWFDFDLICEWLGIDAE